MTTEPTPFPEIRTPQGARAPAHPKVSPAQFNAEYPYKSVMRTWRNPMASKPAIFDIAYGATSRQVVDGHNVISEQNVWRTIVVQPGETFEFPEEFTVAIKSVHNGKVHGGLAPCLQSPGAAPLIYEDHLIDSITPHLAAGERLQ